jgi:hypothetical protein
MAEAPTLTFNVEADPLRERRYIWTIRKALQIHLRSPQSFATRREAREDALKAMSRLAAHHRNKE